MFQYDSPSSDIRNRDRGRLSRKCANEDIQQPVLLIVAPEGIISDALTAAVQRAFPWLSIHRISDLEEARGPELIKAQLVLIDEVFLYQLGNVPELWAGADPGATIALMAPAHFIPKDGLLDRIAAGTISGVLPTDVNLDIWLSIILIMLKGGEYFPPHMFRNFKHPRDSGTMISEMRNAESGIRIEPKAEDTMLENLTTREQEVLKLVAQGLQNKIIAVNLKLSENTVKIHIHNIIRKLGVHNRTEAAALFFNRDRHSRDGA